MADPTKFPSLDAKIASSISKLAKGELGRSIVQQQEIAAKQGKMLMGRQMLFMVYAYFSVSADAGSLYSITDLMSVRLNDDRIENFLNSWNHVLAGMETYPPANELEELFTEQLRFSKILKDEIAHYDRHPKGHPDHSYEYLMRQARAYVDRNRKRQNREKIKRALKGTGKGQPAAPGTKGEGKGSGKKGGSKGSKGKGKGGNDKKICFEWRDNGKCSKGKDCPYSHSQGKTFKKKTKGGEKGSGEKGKEGQKKRICSFFQQGSCKLGHDCTYSHDTADAAPAEGAKKKRLRKKKKNAVSTPAVFAPLVASSLIASASGQLIAIKPGEIQSPVLMLHTTIPVRKLNVPALPTTVKQTAIDTIKSITASNPRRRGVGNSSKTQNDTSIVSKVKRFMALAAALTLGPQRWIMDTGSPFDLVGRNEIPKSYVNKNIAESEFEITLNTANGETDVNWTLPLQVAPLGETVNPFLLENTPAVLSVGRRCMVDGYEFHWPKFKKPYLISPNGYRIELEVENFAPYIREYYKSNVAPAPVDQEAVGDAEQSLIAEPPSAQASEGLEAHDSQGEPSAEDLLQRLAQKKLTKRELAIYDESKSLKHLLCHMPQNPFCDVCRKAKIKKASSFRGKPEERTVAKKFGEKLHADHVTIGDKRDYGFEDERVALALKDDATGMRGFYPQPSKSTDDTLISVQHFLGKVKLTTLRSDNSKELEALARELKVLHETSTPLTPQSNTRIERDIQVVLSGTRSNLQQSGLDLKFWTYAAAHFAHFSNVTLPFCSGKPLASLSNETKTPWELRHNHKYDGPLIPFGSSIDFRTPDSKRFHKSKFESRTQPGLFLGVFLQPGLHYKGDVLVVPLEDFTKDVRPRIVRLKAAEVRFPVIEYDSDGKPKPLEFKFPLRSAKDQQLNKRLQSGGREPLEIIDEGEQDEEKQEETPAGEQGGSEEADIVEEIDDRVECPNRTEWDIPQDDEQKATQPVEHLALQGGGSSSSSSSDPIQPIQPKEIEPVLEPIKSYGGQRGSRRPPHIWPAEAWTWLSKRQKEAAIKEWEDMSPEQKQLATKYLKTAEKSTPAMTAITFEDDAVEFEHPAMPTVTPGKVDRFLKHRDKLNPLNVFNTMVARPVTKSEMESTPEGRAAIEKEWGSHRKRGTWDESSVREWADVSAEAKEMNAKAGKEVIKVHVASLMEVDVEKNSELPKNDVRRKMKCRVVYRGDNTRDELGMAAIFNELSSAPASMEAAKAADVYGLLQNHASETSDAEMAYTQARLKTNLKQDDGSVIQLITWVRVPQNRWPPEWHKKGYKDPVVKLVLALYGHPDAGGCWEQHCNSEMKKVGFAPIPEWQSTFFHARLGLMLVIYVDDLKLAGPAKNLKEGWALIRSKITAEEPTAASGTKFLGAMHTSYDRIIKDGTNPITGICKCDDEKSTKEVKIRVMEYEMKDFMTACVDKYLELTKTNRSELKRASTPFLEVKSEVLYQELEEAEKAGGNAKPGVLQPIAARILMKLLYAARMLRFDLLKAISLLASKITKWSPICDKLLHRLVCYVNDTVEMRLYSWVGDSKEHLHLRLSADADLASDQPSMKSTSGTCLFIAGRNSKAALNARSRKQNAVSHSTPEAELAAVDEGLRTEGLPATELWNVVLGRTTALKLQEDNNACSSIIRTGKNPNIRYMNRTHKINIAWVHECHESGLFIIERCPSSEMEADILTKPITKPEYWNAARLNLSIALPSEVKWKVPPQAAAPSTTGLISGSSFKGKRAIIEFCCGNDSRIGKLADDNCIVVRLTEEHDLTTESGLNHAKQAATDLVEGGITDILLWVSIPCTGGSRWQSYNKKFASARIKIANHIRVFNSIWHSLEILTVFIRSKQFPQDNQQVATSGSFVRPRFRYWVSVEWPSGCAYWKLEKVKKFERENGLSKVRVNGCMVELRSVVSNKLIAKPWDIACNSPMLKLALNGLVCIHSADIHHPCAGVDTKISESYTDIMVKLIHRGFSDQVKSSNDKLRISFPSTPATISMSRSWDSWIVEQCKLQMQFYKEDLADKLLGSEIKSDNAAVFLEKFSKDNDVKVPYSKVFGIASQLVGKREGDRLADGNVVPAPPPSSDERVKTSKCVIVGDSFLCMNKQGKKGDATCLPELWKLSRNDAMKVQGIRGATMKELLPAITELVNYDYIIVSWSMNDVFGKVSARAPTTMKTALPKELKQQVETLAEILKEFKGSAVVFGGDAATWKVGVEFDRYIDEVKQMMDDCAINYCDVTKLARTLTYTEDDPWHALRTGENADKQARFFYSLFKLITGFAPIVQSSSSSSSANPKWIWDQADRNIKQSKPTVVENEPDSRRPEDARAKDTVIRDPTGTILKLDARGERRWRYLEWPNEYEFSKKLSMVLRHKHHDTRRQLQIKPDGFASVSDVIAIIQPIFKNYWIDRNMVETAVRVNKKERFQLRATSSGLTEIRSVQGHTSVKVDHDKVMNRITHRNDYPKTLVHATWKESLKGIIEKGLIRGGPTKTGKDIFFSPVGVRDPNYVSGMRKEAPVETIWNVEVITSYPFFRTASNAIVTTADVIPSSFLLRAINTANGKVLYDAAAVEDKEASGNAAHTTTSTSSSSKDIGSNIPKSPIRKTKIESPDEDYEELLNEWANDDEAKEEGGGKEKKEEEASGNAEHHDDDNQSEDPVGADFDYDDSDYEPQEKCPECLEPFCSGTLLCLKCGKELKAQPIDAEDPAEIQQQVSAEIKEEYGISVKWVEGLKRTPYISRIRRLTAALHSYDKKAKKGKRDAATGQIIVYESYEDRYDRDETFRTNMQKCRPPRGRDFRSLVAALDVPRKKTSEWKQDLIERAEKRAKVDEESKGKGQEKGKGQDKGKGGKTSDGQPWQGWQQWRPRPTAWQAAGAWWVAGWKRSDAAYQGAVVPYADGNIVQYSFPIRWEFLYLMIFVASILVGMKILYQCYKVYLFIKNLFKFEHEEVELYAFRSVGTQSQVHYDRENSRFRAYENGFRRAGEVDYVVHRDYKHKQE